MAYSTASQAIEYTSPDQQVMFVQELSPSVLRCVKDANDNHVSTIRQGVMPCC